MKKNILCWVILLFLTTEYNYSNENYQEHKLIKLNKEAIFCSHPENVAIGRYWYFYIEIIGITTKQFGFIKGKIVCDRLCKMECNHDESECSEACCWICPLTDETLTIRRMQEIELENTERETTDEKFLNEFEKAVKSSVGVESKIGGDIFGLEASVKGSINSELENIVKDSVVLEKEQEKTTRRLVKAGSEKENKYNFGHHFAERCSRATFYYGQTFERLYLVYNIIGIQAIQSANGKWLEGNKKAVFKAGALNFIKARYTGPGIVSRDIQESPCKKKERERLKKEQKEKKNAVKSHTPPTIPPFSMRANVITPRGSDLIIKAPPKNEIKVKDSKNEGAYIVKPEGNLTLPIANTIYACKMNGPGYNLAIFPKILNEDFLADSENSAINVFLGNDKLNTLHILADNISVPFAVCGKWDNKSKLVFDSDGEGKFEEIVITRKGNTVYSEIIIAKNITPGEAFTAKLLDEDNNIIFSKEINTDFVGFSSFINPGTTIVNSPAELIISYNDFLKMAEDLICEFDVKKYAFSISYPGNITGPPTALVNMSGVTNVNINIGNLTGTYEIMINIIPVK